MSDRIHVATRKGLFAIDRGAGGWTPRLVGFRGDPVSLVLDDPRSGRLYAALDLGHFGTKLHVSGDGGETFELLDGPAFAPVPEGEEGPSVKMIWALAGGGPDRPGRLWCGTIPGGLFRSDDDGASWALNEALWNEPMREKWFGGGADQPGIHSIVVDPRDSDRVLVAISCGGVWQTRDAGASWSQCAHGMLADFMPPEQREDPDFQDPHCMVACPTAPDTLWVQHHCGIFKSDDGVPTWRPVEAARPSGFGFAVAVHPHDADTAWFVPAVKDECRVPVDDRLVVSRTRDGGDSFEVITAGLPEGPAYDLVYRHALDVSSDGSRLAFGSTTGGLWVSEDGGDSWSCVTAHLPPVYAVRFAS